MSVDFRCGRQHLWISGAYLDPAPDTTGVHWDAAFGHQRGHVFISQGVWEVPTDALHDHLTGKWRPLKGLVGVIGMPFHGTRRRPPISQQNRADGTDLRRTIAVAHPLRYKNPLFISLRRRLRARSRVVGSVPLPDRSRRVPRTESF